MRYIDPSKELYAGSVRANYQPWQIALKCPFVANKLNGRILVLSFLPDVVMSD